MKNIAPKIDHSRFSLCKVRDELHLVAERSDFAATPFGRVWDDAADVGLVVRGKSRDVTFTATTPIREDGELVAWVFEPYMPQSAERNVRVVIIND